MPTSSNRLGKHSWADGNSTLWYNRGNMHPATSHIRNGSNTRTPHRVPEVVEAPAEPEGCLLQAGQGVAVVAVAVAWEQWVLAVEAIHFRSALPRLLE